MIVDFEREALRTQVAKLKAEIRVSLNEFAALLGDPKEVVAAFQEMLTVRARASCPSPAGHEAPELWLDSCARRLLRCAHEKSRWWRLSGARRAYCFGGLEVSTSRCKRLETII